MGNEGKARQSEEPVYCTHARHSFLQYCARSEPQAVLCVEMVSFPLPNFLCFILVPFFFFFGKKKFKKCARLPRCCASSE